MELTINRLKGQNLILLECISGSRAYGLDTPESDTDIRGVFYMPKSMFYGMEQVHQVSDETNDIVYYELGRYVSLLAKNNPNIIELLNSPEDCVLYRHPLMNRLKKEIFLSKNCQKSFGQYAMAQVKKARGLNKKILNPIGEERKSVLDFCYVAQGQGTVPLSGFLEKQGIDQLACGLSKIPYMQEVYGLYHDPGHRFKGIMPKPGANEVALSSIPKKMEPMAVMSFNKNGYSTYCKEYKEYWDWVATRNDTRYRSTLSHGKNYDAKNMMHTFRLLAMAEEIGRDGSVNVRRRDRDQLLKIKAGDFDYEELLTSAELKMKQIERIYEDTSLPEAPNFKVIDRMLVDIREELYGQ